MSRDYRRRTEARSRRATPGWALFALGFLFGAFSVGYAWLKLGPQELRALAAPVQQPAPAAKPDAKEPDKGRTKEREKEKASDVPRPRFDFYTVLPEMEVLVSDEEVDRRAKHPPPTGQPPAVAAVQPPAPPAPQAPPAPAQTESLLLQVAAFKRPEEAERMKAKLALIGIVADIQSVSINNEAAFYRVRVGPFSNAAKLKDVRDRLKGGGYDSVVVRLK